MIMKNNKRLEYREIISWNLNISWNTNNFDLSIPLEDVIMSILAFTKQWYKLREIPDLVWLSEEEFQAIKYVYTLRRNSELPQELVDWLKEFKWEAYIKKFTKEVIEQTVSNSMNDIIDRKVTRQERQEINKALMYYNFAESLKRDLNEIISNTRPLQKNQFSRKIKILKNDEEVMVSFTDTHLGWPNHENTVKELERFTDFICSLSCKKINLFFLWDLVETFVVEWMHLWQTRELVIQNPYELIDTCVNLLTDMLVKIENSWKVINFKVIPWNHDRDQVDHRLNDNYNTFYSLMNIVKAKVSNSKNIEMEILTEVFNVVKCMWFTFVLFHWHDRTTNNNFLVQREILWLDWYAIWMHWHIHTWFVTQISAKNLLVWVWAFVKWSTYSDSKWYSWLKSFTYLTKNYTWMPEIRQSMLTE